MSEQVPEPSPITAEEVNTIPYITEVMSEEDLKHACLHACIAFMSVICRDGSVATSFMEALERAKRRQISLPNGNPMRVKKYIKWFKDLTKNRNPRDPVEYISKRVIKFLNEDELVMSMFVANIINGFKLDIMEQNMKTRKQELSESAYEFGLDGIQQMKKIKNYYDQYGDGSVQNGS